LQFTPKLSKETTMDEVNEAKVDELLRDPSILLKALRGADDEAATTALGHFKELIRADAMIEATTGYNSLVDSPEIRAELLWLQTARNVYDTISVLPREEALCVLAVRIRHASALMGLSYRDRVTDALASMLHPGVEERPALESIAAQSLAALNGVEDETERLELMVTALQAARKMEAGDKGTGQYL
jgi:hypothetical protein